MVGGASYITHDIPPYTLVGGNRATIRGLNIIGLRRRVENKTDLKEIKSSFKKIFHGGVDREVAAKIARESENPYVKNLAGFVLESNLPL
jgi:UDP-N-acetylglucosamine acyltransferase